MDGGFLLKALNDIDNGFVSSWRVDPSSPLQYPVQISTTTWDEEAWNRASSPQDWPANDPWPPSLPDAIRPSTWKYANVACLAYGKTAKRIRDRCSCSIDAYRADQGFSTNLELRSLTADGAGVGVFPRLSQGKIAAGHIISEICGMPRPLPTNFADNTDQVRQFAIFYPVYSPSNLKIFRAGDFGINVWHDASQQRSVIHFAGHSCEPNLREFFSRIGPTRGIFVKITRDAQIWDQLTLDWEELRFHRPCQDSRINCLCVREVSGQEQ